MRKRMKSLLLVLSMLITMIPVTFGAAETGLSAETATITVVSEHGTLVNGAKITVCLCNWEESEEGYSYIGDDYVYIAESTTGEVEYSVNYDEEKLVYIHDGKEYEDAFAVVDLPEGFESLDGKTRIDASYDPEWITKGVYVRVEDLSDGDSRIEGDASEEVVVKKNDYTVSRSYQYNGVLFGTHIRYNGELKEETVLEALSYGLNEGYIMFDIYGNSFPNISAEVMEELAEDDVDLSCMNKELKASVGFEEIKDKSNFTFGMEKNNNTKLINKIKLTGVDFGFVQYEICGTGQRELTVADWDIAEDLFSHTSENTFEEKYIYFYDVVRDMLVSSSNMKALYAKPDVGEMSRIIYFTMDQYGTYIVSDKELPESLINVNLGLNTTPNPEETPDSEEVVKPQGTWQKDSTGWWYQRADGSYPANAWEKIDGKWYAFDARGYMREGWFKDGATWYYLNYGSGAMATGWVKDGSTWYYMKPSGAMATGWIKDGSTWYYLKSSGAMATGWVKDGGTWYYMNGSGAMQTGWIKDGSTWYYLKSSGAMATGWVNDGGTWYYMNGSGAMQTGWVYTGGKWYYMYESGAMAYNTWIGGYRLDTSGAWVA